MSISVHFKVFSLGQCTELGIFLEFAKISNIFWGIPDYQIFLVLSGDARSKPTYEEKMEVHPHFPLGL